MELVVNVCVSCLYFFLYKLHSILFATRMHLHLQPKHSSIDMLCRDSVKPT